MWYLKGRILDGLSRNLVWSGVGLGVLYWFIESFLHCFFFNEGTFFSQVFSANLHEVWMRSIVAVILVVFGFYAQVTITHLKKAERALRKSENEALFILENNPAAIILVDVETRKIAYANTNAVKMVGTTFDKICGHRCHKFLCPAQEGNCPVLDMGQDIDISERPMLTVDGETVPVLKSVARVQYNGKDHLLEAFFNIAEQKKMQEAIQRTSTELEQIFQTASVGMRLIDCDYNILKVNRAFCELSGLDETESVGRKCYDVFEGSMCHSPECSLKQIIQGNGSMEYEVSKKRMDGSPINCILTATRFEGPDGGIEGVVEAFKDVTELKQSQQDLESERDRLHRILFHQFESTGIVNDSYVLEYQNERLKGKTGGQEGCLCYRVLCDFDAPCKDCWMQKALTTLKIQRFEFDASNGRSFQHTYTPFIDVNGQRKAVVSQRDITERKTSMAAAIRSEHLSALGELAAGVAHEINNPVNGIINYGQMLVHQTKDDDAVNNISHRIIHEGDRIAVIVESLLSFARRGKEKREAVRIDKLVEDALTLTRAQLRKDGIQLVEDLDKNLLPVVARPQEIQQVFVNIINNARYALNERYPEGDKSKIMEISVHVGPKNGNSVVRAFFTDYGTGIAPDVLDKIMNPFFSTKPRGKGTGLGLSISHGIVENHGGNLVIESVSGEFTKVAVELPVQSELKAAGEL